MQETNNGQPTKKLVILIGIPGCGKSTYAAKYAEEHGNTLVVSSDKVREKLYGDENEQGNPKHVFAKVRKEIVSAINGDTYNTVILDATNIKKKDRQSFIEEVRTKATKRFNTEAVLFNIPVDVCKLRNAGRDRNVPEKVIDRMHRQLCRPTEDEGFDNILTVESLD